MTHLKHSIRGCSLAVFTTLSLSGLFTVDTVHAQTGNPDTVSLSVKQAEKIFLEKNLALVAQHYNIEASKALVQQARLWDDPTLVTDQNVYANGKWFEHGTKPDGTPTGQVYAQLQLLIKTAGKRGKQIGMAQTNTAISEWQFNDLMQTLKYQLHTDLYTTAKLLDVQQLYNEQNTQLDKLLEGMTAQFNAGNIARKDLLRVQALKVNLQQDITDNLKQLADYQSELKTMLQMTGDAFIKPIIEPSQSLERPQLNIAALIDTARQNNASYKMEQLQMQYQHQNLSYQKALAIPDITVGPSYDLNSNYTPHYVGLGISLPLPILNGNRGNINAAKWQVKQEEATLSQADIKLQNDVTSACKKYLYMLQLSSNAQQDFYTDYHKQQENIAESFKQRQISMLEFIDYFNDYETVRTRQLQQQLDLQLAKEELNLQVGTDIFQ